MKTEETKGLNETTYVKLYLNNSEGLRINPILAEMLKYASIADSTAEEGGMILYLNKALKANIAKKCEVSLARVDQAVTEFVKKGYIRRVEVGMYQFNPYIFGKGNWQDIRNTRIYWKESEKV